MASASAHRRAQKGPVFCCPRGWGCLSPPRARGRAESGIRTCLSCGRRASIPRASGTTCWRRGLSRVPPTRGAHPSGSQVGGALLPHSALLGGVCCPFPARLWPASAVRRGHVPGPLPPALAAGGGSCPAQAPSHAASCSMARRLSPAEIQTMRESVNKHIFFTVHYLTLASF